MAASLRLTRASVPEGPARFDPRRDLRAVVDLLRLGFGSDLAPQDMRWLDDLSRISGPSLTLQSMAAGLPGAGEATGQVYYQDGQLVGNVSAFRCGHDVWVLANVVTHPAWRGRASPAVCCVWPSRTWDDGARSSSSSGAVRQRGRAACLRLPGFLAHELGRGPAAARRGRRSAQRTDPRFRTAPALLPAGTGINARSANS